MGRGKRKINRPSALAHSLPLVFATHIAKDAFPPRRTPAVNEAAQRGKMILPHPPKVVEIARGVCFAAPTESFGRDYDDNERDGVNDSFLFAVRGHSCISEAAWAAAEAVDDSFSFLGQMAVLPTGELLLKDKVSAQAWDDIIATGATLHQVWYVHDDGSFDSALIPLASVSPETRAGLSQLGHPTADFVISEEALSAESDYFKRFLEEFEERRLLEPVPIGLRSRPSSLSA